MVIQVESARSGGARRGACLDGEFAEIVKALDVIEERIDFVSDRDELGDALCQIVELGHRVQALVGRVGLLAVNNGVAAEHGQRTSGQYVAARTNAQAVEVDRLTKTAKWLRDFPILEAGFGVELTPAHVDYLRKKLDGTYDSHCKLMQDQQYFVDTAASCSFPGFVQACEYWLVHIDPDGKEPKDQIESSRLNIGKGTGGRGLINGECDAATAQILQTAIDHEAQKLRVADKAAGVERSESQRRMAALKNLVERGFARPDGSFPVPLGNIVMSLEVAVWALETLNGETAPPETVPVCPDGVDGRCELLDGTPIHPFLAVHALGLTRPDGAASHVGLRRYVMQANSRLLDVSVTARSFPEWMRTAALVQSRGRCDTHGCDAPHSWLQIDHVDPHTHGGLTRFDNAQPQCRPDNQAKAATTGHTPWRDQPPPPRRRHHHRTQKPTTNTANQNDDDDDHHSDE